MLTILHGDCRDVLPTLPDESVHCCVTSPPYFGLRDYGTATWEGGDPACDHVAFRKPPTIGSSSTLGFSTDGGPRRIGNNNSYHEAYTEQFRQACNKCGAARIDSQIGLEATPDAYVAEMVAVFREVRRVLRDDATLWLNLGDSYAGSWGARGRGEGTNAPRADLESKYGTSAPARNGFAGIKPKDLIGIPWRVAFALQADGWYLRQDIIWSKPNPMPESVTDRCTKAHEYIFLLSKSPRYYYDADAIAEACSDNSHAHRKDGMNTAKQQNNSDRRDGGSLTLSGALFTVRNKRSVWEVTTQPFNDWGETSHFATFPPALIEPCIKAGCPIGGTVLDPFAGAGTTGMVADRLQRNAILIELNPEYSAMAERRIRDDAGMFAEVTAC